MSEDLSVFFADDEFATAVTRQRDGVADLPLSAIIGVSTQDSHQGYVASGQREALFAAADVQDSDTVTVHAGPHAGTYTVARVGLRMDGAEMLGYLVPAA
jgi:hypothetical protein